MANRIVGWLWMAGVLGAIIGVQALDQAGSLARFDGLLNGARVLVPAGIGIAILGVALLIAAMIHGLATDASHSHIPLVIDGRVGSDTTVEPGKIAVNYRGRTALGNEMVLGFFRGRLLWGAELHEKTAMSELKDSWRSGRWTHVHRYLRATLVLVGLSLLVVGIFGTAALWTDSLVVSFVLLLAVAYAVARIAYMVVRA